MEPHIVPSVEDWGEQGDLDEQYAREIFLGKTLAEVKPDFERCVLERSDELRYVAPIPFQYYIFAFRNFVLSPELIHDESASSWTSDAASSFLNLIEEKLETARDHIRPIMPDLMPAIEYVATHQALYKANEEIYGSFSEKLEKIKKLYEKA